MHSKITTIQGVELDFATALHQMNSALLAELMAIHECDSDQELFDAYAAAHAARYGSPFEPCNCCKRGRAPLTATMPETGSTAAHVRMPDGKPNLHPQSDNDTSPPTHAEQEAAA